LNVGTKGSVPKLVHHGSVIGLAYGQVDTRQVGGRATRTTAPLPGGQSLTIRGTMTEDLFATFDVVVKDLGLWLESLGFEAKGRKRRGRTLPYPNGWYLFLAIDTSQHNRRANEKYFFGLRSHLYDDDGEIRWWWSSTSDRPGRQRAQLDRGWQKLDPDSSPEEFGSSLQSDVNAVLAVDGGWEELTHDTDPKSLVSEMRSWISDYLMPAAQLEVEGNAGPTLAGERRSE